MSQDRSHAGELERLSALETLKALSHPEEVKVAELVEYLEARGLWSQFAKITLGDLRNTFRPEPEPKAKKGGGKRRQKKRILEDELGDTSEAAPKQKAPADGGLDTEDIARSVLPFVEGNGEVTFEDLVEYTEIDRKVLRHHLNAMVKDGRLERVGSGRHAVFSTLG